MIYDDSVKLYAVSPWKEMGFGVPAFGDNVVMANRAIANLVDEMGRAQLGIMTHIDARRRKPPSLNTMVRLFKLLRRVYNILASRKVAYNERRLEGGHASPSTIDFILHPVPYFNTQYVKNKWLATYNEYVMVALSHMIQHSDNALPFDITEELASEVWQWLKRVKVMAATELLLVPREEAEKDEWWPDDNLFAEYDPLKVVTAFEALDDPGPFEYWTEDHLRPLIIGIPAAVIKVEDVVRPNPLHSGAASTGNSGQEGAGAGTGVVIPPPEV